MAALKQRPWGNVKPPAGAVIDWGDPINNGLTACWLFSEGAGLLAHDSAGLNDGTIVGGVTRTVGTHGSALAFNGTTGYINIGDRSPLESMVGSAGVMGIVANVNPTSFTIDRYIVGKYAKGGAANGRSYLFGILGGADAGKVVFWAYDSAAANYDSAKSTNVLTAGVMTSVGVTFDNSKSGITNKVAIYINGRQETVSRGGFGGTFTSFVNSTTAALIGGYNPAAVSEPFLGNMSSVRIYGRVKTQSEMYRLYTEPFAGIVTPKLRIRSGAAAAGNRRRRILIGS